MFFDMEMAFPSRSEQDVIEAEVTARTAQTEQIIFSVEAELETLNELRNIIISEAVTGKIKIPEPPHTPTLSH